MEKICPASLDKELDELGRCPNSTGLKAFFQGLMTMDTERKKTVISDAVKKAKLLLKVDQAFQWMVSLYNTNPMDIGVFSPLFLNLVCLQPGQAMFLPPGELHAYLDGVGIELMANSDNVLRGGLTPKHIDLPELLKILNFKERSVAILRPKEISPTEKVYATMAEEFILSVISIKKGLIHLSPVDRSIEILLCMAGNGRITDLGTTDRVFISRGMSVMIPSAVNKYTVEGTATIYKATVPTENHKA
jgi:mannose-6-phosphate isomerase